MRNSGAGIREASFTGTASGGTLTVTSGGTHVSIPVSGLPDGTVAVAQEIGGTGTEVTGTPTRSE